eukprot:g7389.t1
MVLLVMIIYAAAVFFAQFIIDAGAANEEAAGGWLAVPYALYVAFVVLALTNIATGMFVQASLGAHEKQREKVRVE